MADLLDQRWIPYCHQNPTVAHLLFVSLLCCIATVAGKYTGPSDCPSDVSIVGYSSLVSLRTDIRLNSNGTGGQFVLCPNTVFNFSTVPPPSGGDDDLFNDDNIQGGDNNTIPPATEIQAIVITSNNTVISCGDNGMSSNTCIFAEGSFHILISGGPKGILVMGVTFLQASNASIIYTGRGGEVTFRDCIWKENRGDGTILAVDVDVATPVPTPSSTQMPTGTPLPTIAQEVTTFPSQAGIPNVTGNPTVINSTLSTTPSKSPHPTLTALPSFNSFSFAPSLTHGPTASVLQSFLPSLSSRPTITSNPTLTALPTAIGSSRRPSNTPNPSTTPVPSGVSALTVFPTVLPSQPLQTTGLPTVTFIPSSGPTLTAHPSSTNIPSLNESTVPTMTSTPTKNPVPSVGPTLTSQPMGLPTVTSTPISGSRQPGFTAMPSNSTGGPSITNLPSGRPSVSGAPFMGGVKAPSTSKQPSSSYVPSQGPSQTVSPSVSFNPNGSVSIKPTELSSEVQAPTSQPSTSRFPSNNPTQSTSPTQSRNPTFSEKPSFLPTKTRIPTSSFSPSAVPSKTPGPSLSLVPSPVSRQMTPALFARTGIAATTKESLLTLGSARSVTTSSVLSDAPSIPGSLAPTGTEKQPVSIVFSTAPTASTVAFDSLGIVEITDGLSQLKDGEVADVLGGVLKGTRHWRVLQKSGALNLAFEDCLFENNDNNLAAILIIRGRITILNSEFVNNTANGAVVAAYGGDFSIENSTFLDNAYQFLPSPVFLDYLSTLDSNVNNCAFSNGVEMKSPKQTCNDGIFVQTQSGDCFNVNECVGNCERFTSQLCIVADCYSDWGQLSLAIKQAPSVGTGRTFQLCPGTLFNVDQYPDPALTPIRISIGDTLIRCGINGNRDESCVVRGGTTQFRVEGNSTNIMFLGVTFLSSRKTSISASGEASSELAFIDCAWAGHTGSSVIEIYNGGIDVVDGLELADIPAPKRESMTVMLVNCTIIGNVVTFASISNFNGILFVDGTLFTEIVAAGGAIVTLFKGSVDLVKSCFINVKSDNLPGIAFVQAGSILLSNKNNFGERNNSTTVVNCNEVFSESSGSCIVNTDTCGGTCLPLQSKRCLATDIVSPPTLTPSAIIVSDAPSEVPSFSLSQSPSSIGCFAEWDALSAAVGLASSSDVSTIFTICSNTFMNVDFFPQLTITPIVVGIDGIIIQCGINGSADDNCVIFGGKSQFEIVKSAAQVEFRGLKFVGSRGVVIRALGDSKASATFSDCTFSKGIGTSAIFLYGGKLDMSATINTTLLPKQGEAMSVRLRNCTISDNDFEIAPLVNFGGNLNVKLSLFINNEGEVGAIVVRDSGLLSVSDSCFLSNTAKAGPGTILLDRNSTLVKAEGNFGRGNSVSANVSCTEIALIEVDNVMCIPFDANTCVLSELLPTSAPSTAPTTQPSEQFSSPNPSSAPNLLCFAEWDTLSHAIQKASETDTGGIFTLCSDSLFDVSAFPQLSVSPIAIFTSDIIIQCGNEGERRFNCTVSGGINQFLIRGTVSNVKFLGVTFINSMGISVHAAGTETSTVSFVDCEWRGNEGTSALLILQRSSRILSNSMTVEILQSNFTDNNVVNGAVLNVGGKLFVQNTVFVQNVGESGAIGILEKGEISVLKSCFVNNQAGGKGKGGAINLQDNSTFIRDSGNFGIGNTLCNGILSTADEIDAICGRACTVFMAEKCAVVDIAFQDVPTSSPSISLPPVCAESDAPSSTPTIPDDPTIQSQAPTGTSRPTNTGQPSETPTYTGMPSNTANPNGVIDITEAPSPVENQPSIGPTSTPSLPTSKPTTTEQPTLADTEQPSITEVPTMTGPPTLTSKPSTSERPTSTETPTNMEVPTFIPTATFGPTPMNSSAPTVSSPIPSNSPSNTLKPSILSNSINPSFMPSSLALPTRSPTVTENPTIYNEMSMSMSMSFSYDYFFYNH